jgi:hypothetical protein
VGKKRAKALRHKKVSRRTKTACNYKVRERRIYAYKTLNARNNISDDNSSNTYMYVIFIPRTHSLRTHHDNIRTYAEE